MKAAVLVYFFGIFSCGLGEPGEFSYKKDIIREKYLPEFQWMYSLLDSFVVKVDNLNCRRQLLTYIASLKNASLWAVQMLDASANIPEKLSSWKINHLGHFDECLEVNLKRKSDNIYGKYCLARVETTSEGGNICSVHKFSNEEVCQKENQVSRKITNRIGICIPNECSHKDLEKFLVYYYDNVFMDCGYKVKVQEKACSTNDTFIEGNETKIIRTGILSLIALFIPSRYIFLILAVWITSITIIDLFRFDWKGFDVVWNRIAETFSAYRNFRRLSSVNGEKYSGIHSLKVIAIVVLILCRRQRILQADATGTDKDAVSTGHIFDTLLFTCGFLIAKELQEDFQLQKKRDCFIFCFKKWMRLAPLYLLVLRFYISTLADTGNGPFWTERIGAEVEHCTVNWWTNVLFMNNYMTATKQCIAQSWYLTAIAHCTVVTVIFVYLKNKRALMEFISFCLLLATLSVLFVWNDYAFLGKEIRYSDPILNEFLQNIYIKTHNRFPCYFIGVATAILCSSIRRSKEGITRVQIVLISFMCTVFALVAVVNKSISEKSDVYSKVIHTSTSSLTWCLFLGCVAVVCSIKNLNAFKPISMKSVFIPLSRLSYPVLLLHEIIQLYTFGTDRTAERVPGPRMLSMGLGDVFLSYAFAMILHLGFEATTSSAINMLLPEKVNESSKDLEDQKAGKT